MQHIPIISTPLLLWGIRQKPIFTNNKNAPDPRLPDLFQTAAQPSFAQFYTHPINPLAKILKKIELNETSPQRPFMQVMTPQA